MLKCALVQAFLAVEYMWTSLVVQYLNGQWVVWFSTLVEGC
jgi:hypothetical protein